MSRSAAFVFAPVVLLAGQLAAAPPKVVITSPDNGEVDVDPATRQLQVDFDQPMDSGSFSVVGGGPMFPQIAVLGSLYTLITELKLYNTLWALILTYLIFTLPFTDVSTLASDHTGQFQLIVQLCRLHRPGQLLVRSHNRAMVPFVVNRRLVPLRRDRLSPLLRRGCNVVFKRDEITKRRWIG